MDVFVIAPLPSLRCLFQRRAVGQFRDRGFGIPAQHFARFVRIANNTNRILSERPKFLDHRASGIARCSDYRNRHRRLLPTTDRRIENYHTHAGRWYVT